MIAKELSAKIRRINSQKYLIDLPDQAGERKQFFSLKAAENWIEKNAHIFGVVSPRRPRACLCCHEQFMSEGNHNRMCQPCRYRADDDQHSPYGFGTLHGRKRA